MSKNPVRCPDRDYLQQFLLGQLSLPEIEDCQQHLSHCMPCVDTLHGLKVTDTFADVTRQAMQSAANGSQPSDEELIDGMIAGAKDWTVDSLTTQDSVEVSLGKAAEVQRLLRPPLQAGDLGTIAHFRLVELIGTGSTGIVYLAIDTKLERDVVLKILRPSLGTAAQQRFVAEAKATAAINHPNVVTIYEVGNDGPLSFIAMQWIPGQTLEQKLDSEKTLDVESVKKLVEGIASGLVAAHAKGLIHRDIKPANVWIPENQEPAKILDFGLVRVNDEDPQLTCTGMIAGTPCFMSPEQSRGDDLDARSDLFSLGCLMYRAMTGKLPFRSENALATLRSIQQDQPTEPHEMDPAIDLELSDLVMCLLEKSPNRRPDSASELIDALHSPPKDWAFEIHKHTAVAKTQPQKPDGSRFRGVAALLTGIALAAFGFAYGQQVIRVVTGQGEIVIDTKVEDIKIEVVGNGEVVKVIDLTTDQSIEIKAGQYELRPVGEDNSISIDKNVLTLSRGETEIVTITRNEDVDRANLFVGDTYDGSDPPGPLTRLTLIEPLIRRMKLDLNAAKQKYAANHPAVQSLERQIAELTRMNSDDETDKKILMTYQMKYTSPQSIYTAVQNILRLDAANSGIAVDYRTDTLIVNATSQVQTEVQSLIKAMDVPAKESRGVEPVKLKAGDVLGIFVEGVLGGYDEQPPIHQPAPGSGLTPAIGYPITVEYNGIINLPLVGEISVAGMSIAEAREELNKVFKTGKNPILRNEARVMVSLIRSRNFPGNPAAMAAPSDAARTDAARQSKDSEK